MLYTYTPEMVKGKIIADLPYGDCIIQEENYTEDNMITIYLREEDNFRITIISNIENGEIKKLISNKELKEEEHPDNDDYRILKELAPTK